MRRVEMTTVNSTQNSTLNQNKTIWNLEGWNDLSSATQWTKQIYFLLRRWSSKSKLLLSEVKGPIALLMALYYKFDYYYYY